MSDKYQVSSETLKKEVEEALTSAEQAEEESPEKEKLKAHALKLHDEYKQALEQEEAARQGGDDVDTYHKLNLRTLFLYPKDYKRD